MKKIDVILDVIILLVLMFTIYVCAPDIYVTFILILVGCGALYNNVKYLFRRAKREKEQKQENENENK